MGLVRTKISLGNPKRPDLVPIEVDGSVDTGALHLCIPPHVAIQLQLEEREKREVTVADGSKHLVPYVGPLMADFGKRSCFTGAMVLGDDVILGAIPMEDMDLVVRPATRDIVPNPSNPNIPASIAMGAASPQKRSAEHS
jgi:clan AA aspartic protease